MVLTLILLENSELSADAHLPVGHKGHVVHQV